MLVADANDFAVVVDDFVRIAVACKMKKYGHEKKNNNIKTIL